MLNYIPQFFTKKAITIYCIALCFISLLFFSYSMDFIWIFFGLLEVIGFFYFSNLLSKRWSRYSPKLFKKKLFTTSLIIRLIWAVFSYYFYIWMTGEPFEFSAADSKTYQELALDLSTRGYTDFQYIFRNLQFNDMGYATYLGTLYMATGKSILFARIMKALWSSLTALLIYKLASRTFGESIGRIAGIIAMLFPNFIYYCGLHLKEVEMVFLTTLFLERADYLLRSRQFNIINTVVLLLVGLSLFAFRTVLGVAALFALFSALTLTSARVSKIGNRFVFGVWVIIAVVYFASGTIALEVEQYWEGRFDNQDDSMELRATAKGGNKLAKYGSGFIFAPAIFVIPVSTMVGLPNQQNQQIINGGNYVKNILSFFIYLSIFFVLKRKKWRDFVLIEVFFLAYLGVIALSAFAHSERFHQPALPVYVMFIAYGISTVTNKSKKYFNYYTVLVFLALVAWNFIKLSGRGLI